ncbi:MAG: hypothetical protein WC707_03090 [Candidatus Babeliaceae bacterium]
MSQLPVPQCSSCATKILKEFASEIYKSALVISDQEIHPLLSECALDTLFDIAIKTKSYMKEKHPSDKYKVFSLGQSPAWLVAMMKLIDEVQGVHDTQYDFIAFSSGFFEYDLQHDRFKRWKTPSLEEVNIYKKYLDTLDLDLKKDTSNESKKRILSKTLGWKKNTPVSKKTHTFILEFPHHANSMLSFEEVAKSHFPKDFNFLVSQPYSKRLPGSTEILRFIDQEAISNLIVPLANSDYFDDRLVMRYPIFDWTQKDPSSFHMSSAATLLHKIVEAYVDCRYKISSKTEISNSMEALD